MQPTKNRPKPAETKHSGNQDWLFSKLLEAAKEEIGGRMNLHRGDTGAHLIGWLPDDIDPDAVSRQAERRNITAIPISRYCISPYPSNGLMPGFGYTRPENIRPAVHELALAIDDARRS
jgi:DNA-binding transcriptional MocR family regulator